MESPNYQKKDKPSKLKEKSDSYLKAYGVAFEIVVFNIVCIWGGIELSSRFTPKSNIILFASILFAMAGTIYYLFKRLIK